ncbi:MAG TPA: hypothetical protein PLC42_00900, partial [Parachlamydiaceae bacterium]|nr:hypothetical protein [Parachlamydiaceae bacterium]
MFKWLSLLYLILFLFPLHAKEEEETKNKPPEIGNFALPTSQQPAALFGFGGNIIDEGEIQVNLFADPFIASKRFSMDVIPGILYGITDDFSLYLNFPYASKFKDQTGRSCGIEDLYLQFEYAFYSKTTKRFADQATIVANMTFPTGSIRKNPPTGFGSPAFFLGATYYHTTVEWIFFTGQGTLLTSSVNKTKTGEIFYSQYGIGKNLKSPKGWIYAALFELDGQYANKNKIF